MRPHGLLLFTLTLVLAAPALAQQPSTATTDSGRTVLLYPDGTWKYKDQASSSSPAAKSYTKSPAATARLSLADGKAVVNYDAKKWRQDKPGEDPDIHKFSLVLDGQDSGCVALAARNETQMAPDMAEAAFLVGVKRQMPDAHVTSEEKRLVNGKEVLCAQVSGTAHVNGMTLPMVMLNYFYSGKEGTIMASAIAPGFLFDEHRAELEQFLNGLEIVP